MSAFSPAPNRGCTELRRAIAAYLARSRGIIADPEQIIVGSGAEYLYGLVVQLLGRGCMFALEDPSYEKIRLVYEANGADCVMLKMARTASAVMRSSAVPPVRCTSRRITAFRAA